METMRAVDLMAAARLVVMLDVDLNLMVAMREIDVLLVVGRMEMMRAVDLMAAARMSTMRAVDLAVEV